MSNKAKYAIGCVFVFWALTVPGFSQTPSPTPAPFEFSKMADEKIEQAEKRVAEKLEKYCDDRISKLEGKFDAAEADLEKRSEKQFDSMGKLFAETKDSFRWLVDRATTIIFVLVGIAGAFFWKHDKSLKETIEKRVAEAELKIQEKISELTLKSHKSIDELSEKINEFDTMKEHYVITLEENKNLRNQLESIAAYRRKKVVWAYEKADIDATSEINEILNKGFQVEVCKQGDERKINLNDCDLLIYYYRNTPQAKERIKIIGDLLKEKSVPLIIYTYKCGTTRVPDEELSQLGGFDNYILANMPLTLESHFNSLIRM